MRETVSSFKVSVFQLVFTIWSLMLLSAIFNALLPFDYIQMEESRILYRVPLGYLPFYLVAIIGILGLSLFFKGFIKGLASPPYLYLYLLLFYEIISIVWVKNYLSWFVYLGMWFFHALIFLYLSQAICQIGLVKRENFINRIIRPYVYVVSLISFIGLVKFFLLGHIDANPWPLINRNGYIFFVVPVIPLITFFMLRTKHPIERIFYIMILLLNSMGILSVFSRMGFIGLIFSLGNILLIDIIRFRWKFLFNKLILLLVILGSISGIIFISPSKMILNARVTRLSQDVISLAEQGKIDELNRDYRRYVLMLEGIRIFKQNWIKGTGLGLDNYLYYFQADVKPGRPHNLYISSLSEFGVIGCFFLFLFLGYLCFLPIKYAKLKSVKYEDSFLLISFFSGEIAIMIMFLFNEYITAPFVWFYWAIVMGYIRVINMERQQRLLNEVSPKTVQCYYNA